MKYKKEIVKTLNENYNFPVEFEKMTFSEIVTYVTDIIKGKNPLMNVEEFTEHTSCQRLISLSLRQNPDQTYKTYECVPCKTRGIKSIVEYHGKWTHCNKCEQYQESQWESQEFSRWEWNDELGARLNQL